MACRSWYARIQERFLMTVQKMHKDIVAAFTIVFVASLLIMIACLSFMLVTLTPTMGSVRDYMKEGRLTMFVVGVTIGMSFVSAALLYYVSSLKRPEENIRTFAGDLPERRQPIAPWIAEEADPHPSRSGLPTPRALRAVPSNDRGPTMPGHKDTSKH